MARMTIAQMREREVLRLARAKEENPSAETIREAQRLMNSFYRLAALDDRNLYLSNNERTANSRYTAQSEERAYKWWLRLRDEFRAFCGYSLEYFGHLPTITDGDGSQKISAFYYN